MACSSCRKAPVWRRPEPTVRGGRVLPGTPPATNKREPATTRDEQRSKITGLKYVPK